MSATTLNHLMEQTVAELSESSSLRGLFHKHNDGEPLPSGAVLSEIVDLCRAILFPGFYGHSTLSSQTLHYHMGVNVEHLYALLSQQIQAGLCFCSEDDECNGERSCLAAKAQEMAEAFIARLPKLRSILATDVEAAYNGDPAAESYGEIISCYPVIKAVTNYRIAHELLVLGVPLIPRIITEMAHSETGIAGCQKLPVGREGQSHKGCSPPSYSRGRRYCVQQRNHPGTHHIGQRYRCGR